MFTRHVQRRDFVSRPPHPSRRRFNESEYGGACWRLAATPLPRQSRIDVFTKAFFREFALGVRSRRRRTEPQDAAPVSSPPAALDSPPFREDWHYGYVLQRAATPTPSLVTSTKPPPTPATLREGLSTRCTRDFLSYRSKPTTATPIFSSDRDRCCASMYAPSRFSCVYHMRLALREDLKIFYFNR